MSIYNNIEDALNKCLPFSRSTNSVIIKSIIDDIRMNGDKKYTTEVLDNILLTNIKVMKKNKRIYFGILHSWLVHQQHSDHLRQLVRTIEQHTEIRWMNYDEVRSGLSGIIIPDGVGISPLAKGLINMVQSPLVCPEAAVFVETTLDTYRERAYPIIGIGDGAVLLWELLGNPVGYFNGRLRCLPPTNESLIEYTTDGSFVERFAYMNIYGFNEINGSFSNLVRQIVDNIELEAVEVKKEENSWDV